MATISRNSNTQLLLPFSVSSVFLRVLCVSALLTAGHAAAQPTFPSRPITIVVPYTPATGADQIARLIGPKLSEKLGTAVVVENKAGASGAIGADFVAKSAPDGHTLLFTATAHGTVPALRRDLPYDAAKSFTPVALAATSAMTLVVSPQSGITRFADFVAAVKKQPGALHYSSPGNGTPQHLTMELVKLETGMDIAHVPYKGSAGATTDLVGGHVQASISALQTAAPYVTSGRMRMLAVLSPERSSAFPDVPTMKELGHPNLVVETWYGVFAPAGTAPEVVARLNAAINEALRTPEVRDAMAKQGQAVVTDKPERLGTLLAQELERWNRVVASAKITGD